MNDYISRQEAVDAIMKLAPSLTTPDGSGEFDAEIIKVQEMFVDIGQVLNDLPSVDVQENVYGKWRGNMSVTLTCSICDFNLNSDKVTTYNFCPNCGADMRGEEEKEI